MNLKRFLWPTVIAAWFLFAVSVNVVAPPVKTVKPPPSNLTVEIPPFTGFNVVEYVLFQHYEYGIRIAEVSSVPVFELDPRYFHFIFAVSDDGREVVWGGSPNPVWGEPYQQYGNLTISLDWTDPRTEFVAPEGYEGPLPYNPYNYEPPPQIALSWQMLRPSSPELSSPFMYHIESSPTLDGWARTRDCPWSYGAGYDGTVYEGAFVLSQFKRSTPTQFFRLRIQSSATWEVYIEDYYIDGIWPTKINP